ncbi:hypothetical protein [Natronobacterium texcoconense]|uniref:Uncharacterized protein n=1 Tax=Natronobacterium texcoconense TaxID=1095778 RepID=A0A1H1CC99_NATTX|nr:hypothetical protein [Natronobacterium texcoconense]SDQ61823.1 hypothetical protein SAMN04489842_1353 [Natronobacterium texcoconense]
MFGVLTLLIPLLGAYAVYVDATARETDSPIGWAALTLIVGYGLGTVFVGAFLSVYLVSHVVEEWWTSRQTNV